MAEVPVLRSLPRATHSEERQSRLVILVEGLAALVRLPETRPLLGAAQAEEPTAGLVRCRPCPVRAIIMAQVVVAEVAEADFGESIMAAVPVAVERPTAEATAAGAVLANGRLRKMLTAVQTDRTGHQTLEVVAAALAAAAVIQAISQPGPPAALAAAASLLFGSFTNSNHGSLC